MSQLWARPVLLAVLSLAVLGLLVWLPRRVVPAQSLALFRALVPAWRFFEEIDPVPALRYRVAPHGDDWGDWQEALVVPARSPTSLWLNAAGNLHLACQSLVEHLVADLEEAAELGRAEDELVSYQLVCALVEQRARGALPWSAPSRFQFRLDEAPSEGLAPALFLSRVHGST